MDFSRKKFLKLAADIVASEIGAAVAAHKDRLARFGFEPAENLAGVYGCGIIAANKIESSPQQEMVEGLTPIMQAPWTEKMQKAGAADADSSQWLRGGCPEKHCGCARLACNVCLEGYAKNAEHPAFHKNGAHDSKLRSIPMPRLDELDEQDLKSFSISMSQLLEDLVAALCEEAEKAPDLLHAKASRRQLTCLPPLRPPLSEARTLLAVSRASLSADGKLPEALSVFPDCGANADARSVKAQT
ncbi:MAG: hypothetical protein LBU32_00015 [Clostridiales bacterium]|jgi:hypothetical protein|nr:hypothetical protein [Clostridiales bacterium]